MSLIAIAPAIIIFAVGKNFKNFDIFLSFAFLILCICYGFSKDFFFFVFGFFALICLFFASLFVAIYKFWQNKSIRNLLISVFLIILAPIAAKISNELYPYQMFYQWVLFHPMEFEEVKGQEGFLQEIDAWGFAGMDSSLMLASSQHYNLTVSKDLQLWKIKNKITCDVFHVYKVYPNIYTILPYTDAECSKKIAD